METQLTLDTVLLAPEFADVPNSCKRLIKQALSKGISEAAVRIKAELKAELEANQPTTRQQIDTIEAIALTTLRKGKAKKIICAYSAEVFSAREHKLNDSASTEKIRMLIREEISADNNNEGRSEPAVPPAYHTADEIRRIILNNLESIHDYFSDRKVHKAALDDHLSRYTMLKEGDLLRQGNGCKRWSSQVGNAININNWKQSPIRPTGEKGYYVIEMWRSAP